MTTAHITQDHWLDPDTLRQQQTALSQTSWDILSCHYWQCDSTWSLAERQLDDDFVFIPAKGAIDATLNQQPYTIRPGQCLFAPCGAYHSAHMPATQHSLDIIAIHIHMHTTTSERSTKPDEGAVMNLTNIDEDIRFLKQGSYLHAQGHSAFAPLLIHWLQHLWLYNVGRTTQLNLHTITRDVRVQQCLDIIHRDYATELDVATLAKDAKLSTVQLRKLFHRDVGQTPKAYIANTRLRLAAQQLQHSNLTIRTIALDTGFSDEHYFHLCFKKRYRMTPSQYRHQRQVQP